MTHDLGDAEEGVCVRCGEHMSTPVDYEPTKHCHNCAHELVAHLAQELAARWADGERLNWLEREAAEVGVTISGPFEDHDDSAITLSTDAIHGPYKTLREAIDDRMKERAK